MEVNVPCCETLLIKQIFGVLFKGNDIEFANREC